MSAPFWLRGAALVLSAGVPPELSVGAPPVWPKALVLSGLMLAGLESAIFMPRWARRCNDARSPFPRRAATSQCQPRVAASRSLVVFSADSQRKSKTLATRSQMDPPGVPRAREPPRGPSIVPTLAPDA